MSATSTLKWLIEANYLQACNCDYGCPCEFSAPPTKGFCEGMGAWQIKRGRYGDLPLDGLSLAFAAHWPKAIHEGNGTLALFIEEKANAKQREGLLKIAKGELGGLPFEILAVTISKVLDPQYVPFQFTFDGLNSRVQIGNAAAISTEPIKNPVTGEPEDVRVEHGTGFIFKEADCVSAKDCRVSVAGLSFSWPNKAGFVAKISYAN